MCDGYFQFQHIGAVDSLPSMVSLANLSVPLRWLWLLVFFYLNFFFRCRGLLVRALTVAWFWARMRAQKPCLSKARARARTVGTCCLTPTIFWWDMCVCVCLCLYLYFYLWLFLYVWLWMCLGRRVVLCLKKGVLGLHGPFFFWVFKIPLYTSNSPPRMRPRMNTRALVAALKPQMARPYRWLMTRLLPKARCVAIFFFGINHFRHPFFKNYFKRVFITRVFFIETGPDQWAHGFFSCGRQPQDCDCATDRS